jgi:hypothetical protein
MLGMGVAAVIGLFAVCVLRLQYRWFALAVVVPCFFAMYGALVVHYERVVFENQKHSEYIAEQEYVDLWDPAVLNPTTHLTSLNHRVLAYNALVGAILTTLLASILFKPLEWLTARVRGTKQNVVDSGVDSKAAMEQ